MASAANEPGSALEGAKGAAEAVGKTAVAAALAGAVASGAAAVTPDQINLPEPVPIVQVADQGVDQPDSTVEDQDTKKSSALKRILTILKYAIIAILAIAGIVFAVLQAAVSCAGPLALPPAGSDSSASASSSLEQAA